MRDGKKRLVGFSVAVGSRCDGRRGGCALWDILSRARAGDTLTELA